MDDVAPRLRQPRRLQLVVALVVAVSTAASAPALAQVGIDDWRVGVIVSRSAGSPLGAQQAVVADAVGAALGVGGVFGTPFVVDVRDDGGDPRRALAQAEALERDGVVALVCCTTVAATEQVSTWAERTGVPLLTLDGTPPASAVWTRSVRADARTQLTTVAVESGTTGQFALALMAPDNAFGDAIVEAFERATSDAGRLAAGVARYAPGAPTLIPEALWAATRVPGGAVLAWGGAADTDLALRSLRQRGWVGASYARPEALPTAAWGRLALGVPTDATVATAAPWTHVRSVVAPIAVAGLLGDAHPNRAAALASEARIAAALGSVPRAQLGELAIVDDALHLLHGALEQVAALGLGALLDAPRARQALMDALVSAPERPLAAGTYEARSTDARLARWNGLVVVHVE